jgi:hypothetical protein
MQTEERLPTAQRSALAWPLIILGLLLLLAALIALLLLYAGNKPHQVTFEDFMEVPPSTAPQGTEEQRQPAHLELQTEPPQTPRAPDDYSATGPIMPVMDSPSFVLASETGTDVGPIESKSASFNTADFSGQTVAQADALNDRRAQTRLLAHLFQGQGKSPRVRQIAPASEPLNTIQLDASTHLVNPCPEASSGTQVRLNLTGLETSCSQLTYGWSVNGGRIIGSGRNVVWDLSDTKPGIYKVDLKVESGPACKCQAFASTRVGVQHCIPAQPYTPPPTPLPTPTPIPEPTFTPQPTQYPTATVTPTANPRPTQTPTPNPRPTSSPTPYPLPSPTPTQYPSPSSSPTPSPTPSPTGLERYKITVHYQDRFRSVGDEETITFDLEKALAKPAVSENNGPGSVRLIDAVYQQQPGITVEAPRANAFEIISRTLARVRLVSDDLTIVSNIPAEQSLDKPWSWKVKPAHAGMKEASFTFVLDLVRRTEGQPDITTTGVWKPANPFKVPVGSAVANYLPWLLLLLLLGLAALLLGIFLWKRRPDLRIDHIVKSDRKDPRKRITHVSGLNPGTDERWTISTERAVEYIENGTFKFHTLADDYRANVIVRTSRTGNKYLKTEGDTDNPNNLLSLPELTE